MGSIFSVFVFLVFGAYADCDKNIVKVAVPIKAEGKTSLCFDEYFYIRDLANKSISDDTAQVFNDTQKMQFDDMLLFSYDSPMGEAGRVAIIRDIYQSYKQSLRNEYGACTVSLFSGSKELTIADFKQESREAEGQPGTRLIIKSEDISEPRWQLQCPSATGELVVSKTDDYFFIFIDVYENIGTMNLKNHLSKFLFSYR